MTANGWVALALKATYGEDAVKGPDGEIHVPAWVESAIEDLAREQGWDALDTLALVLIDQDPGVQGARVRTQRPLLPNGEESAHPVVIVELFSSPDAGGWKELGRVVDETWEQVGLKNPMVTLVNRVVRELLAGETYAPTSENFWTEVKRICEAELPSTERKSWRAWMEQWRRANPEKVRARSEDRNERRGRPKQG